MPRSYKIDEGPFPGTCVHMAYLPRSAMTFPGDIHRDFQIERRLDTISEWVGLAAQIYLNAARMLDLMSDPIADCLAADHIFDARTVWAVHDHMANHWRAHWLERALAGTHLRVEPPFKCVPIYTYRDLQYAFRRWLLEEPRLWSVSNAPRFRLMYRAIVGNHNHNGKADELAFFLSVITQYHLPD